MPAIASGILEGLMAVADRQTYKRPHYIGNNRQHSHALHAVKPNNTHTPTLGTANKELQDFI